MKIVELLLLKEDIHARNHHSLIKKEKYSINLERNKKYLIMEISKIISK